MTDNANQDLAAKVREILLSFFFGDLHQTTIDHSLRNNPYLRDRLEQAETQLLAPLEQHTKELHHELEVQKGINNGFMNEWRLLNEIVFGSKIALRSPPEMRAKLEHNRRQIQFQSAQIKALEETIHQLKSSQHDK